MSNSLENAAKTEQAEKMPKPYEKFIWLAVSVAIAVLGYIFRVKDIVMPWWGNALFAAFLLFTIIIAAQKMSVERFALVENKEKRSKCIIASIIYYIFIFIAVFYVFYALWVARVLSI